MSAALLWRLVRGDLRERMRGNRFLLITAATAALGTLFVPEEAGYTVLTVGGYRGIYNSAWVGASVALVTTMFLSLFGFYLVSDAVRRDRQTGVGQVLASTSLTRSVYILSKALSNLALLSILVGVLLLVAAGMQLLRGEATTVEPWPLLAPFLWVTLPGLAVVAALAILFESVRPLRGTLGSVLYFFLWIGLLALGMGAAESGSSSGWAFDVFGISLLYSAIRDALLHHTASTGALVVLGFGESVPRTFVWEGMDWSPAIVTARLLWLLVGALLTALAIPFFDRFDSPPPSRRTDPRQGGGGEALSVARPEAPAWLKQGPGGRTAFALLSMVRQELRLLLRGTSLWWHISAGGLILLTFSVPDSLMYGFWLLAWLWPLGHWSRLATREVSARTEDLILGAAHTVRRQFPAAWLAGLVLALLTGSGALTRLALSQSWPQLAAGLIGAVFIPSLALALGTATRSERPFQVLYIVMWYAGPVEGLAPLDFIGLHQETLQMGVPVYYLLLSLLALAIATYARWRHAYSG